MKNATRLILRTMDVDALHRKLILAARAHPPSEAVPYGFQVRIMSHLLTETALDVWTVWNRALWRAALPCLGIMCATLVWSAVEWNAPATESSLAAQLETTLLVPLAQLQETW